jgi:1,4-alpha-glucan branching enzyme
MVQRHTDGTVEFRIFLAHAGSVELVGDFTEWRTGAVSMSREHPGWWSVRLPVPPGTHQFCYLVDGAIWLADYAADGVSQNLYGGWVSRLHVPETDTLPLGTPGVTGRLQASHAA